MQPIDGQKTLEKKKESSRKLYCGGSTKTGLGNKKEINQSKAPISLSFQRLETRVDVLQPPPAADVSDARKLPNTKYLSHPRHKPFCLDPSYR